MCDKNVHLSDETAAKMEQFIDLTFSDEESNALPPRVSRPPALHQPPVDVRSTRVPVKEPVKSETQRNRSRRTQYNRSKPCPSTLLQQSNSTQSTMVGTFLSSFSFRNKLHTQIKPFSYRARFAPTENVFRVYMWGSPTVRLQQARVSDANVILLQGVTSSILVTPVRSLFRPISVYSCIQAEGEIEKTSNVPRNISELFEEPIDVSAQAHNLTGFIDTWNFGEFVKNVSQSVDHNGNIVSVSAMFSGVGSIDFCLDSTDVKESGYLKTKVCRLFFCVHIGVVCLGTVIRIRDASVFSTTLSCANTQNSCIVETSSRDDYGFKCVPTNKRS